MTLLIYFTILSYIHADLWMYLLGVGVWCLHLVYHG